MAGRVRLVVAHRTRLIGGKMDIDVPKLAGWSGAVKSFCGFIDLLNEWAGKIFGWLIVPMIILVVYDVILRYIFNNPTIWSWDINVQLLGALVVFSGGYVLLHGAHVGVDALVIHLSSRGRAIVDLITSMFFFFSFGVLLWTAACGCLVFSGNQRNFTPAYFRAAYISL